MQTKHHEIRGQAEAHPLHQLSPDVLLLHGRLCDTMIRCNTVPTALFFYSCPIVSGQHQFLVLTLTVGAPSRIFGPTSIHERLFELFILPTSSYMVAPQKMSHHEQLFAYWNVTSSYDKA